MTGTRRLIVQEETAAQNAALSVRRVSKRFGGTEVLSDVSLEVFPGEVLCVLGDNGAGKSTLIKIMSGVLVPSAGEVLLRGSRVVFDSPRAAREAGIATVQQFGGTVPLMSVSRNFFLGAELTKGRGPFRRMNHVTADAIALESLAKFGLTRVKDARRMVGSLSGGERQSLAIARALHFGAKVLVLDEPTSALGVKEAATVLRLVRQAAARGIAVVLVTHNATHAISVGNRYVILIHGAVAASFASGERTRAELIDLMAGGEQLEELERELEATQPPM